MEQIVTIARPGNSDPNLLPHRPADVRPGPHSRTSDGATIPLMIGLGGLYGAIEWFGKIDAQLRALLNVHVAALYRSPY